MPKTTKLKDLADELNISITTVSKALNGHPDISKERRQQILELAAKRNYIPNEVAKSFRQQKTKFVGIVLSDNTNPYYARVIRGIEETLSENGYHSIIFNTNEDPERELKLLEGLRSLNVAGVIITPANGNAESCALLRKYGIPYVLAHRYIPSETNDCVTVDDFKVAYLAVNHLISKKRARIFFLNFTKSVSPTIDRFEGYKKALADNKMKYDPQNVIFNCCSQSDGYEQMSRIIKNYSPPYSVLCYSDYIALGAMSALIDNHIKIPEEVAIMGIDDISILNYIRPSLTTIGIPKKRLGIRSAKLLLDVIENHENHNKTQIVLDPELIVRETT